MCHKTEKFRVTSDGNPECFLRKDISGREALIADSCIGFLLLDFLFRIIWNLNINREAIWLRILLLRNARAAIAYRHMTLSDSDPGDGTAPVFDKARIGIYKGKPEEQIVARNDEPGIEKRCLNEG